MTDTQPDFIPEVPVDPIREEFSFPSPEQREREKEAVARFKTGAKEFFFAAPAASKAIVCRTWRKIRMSWLVIRSDKI